MNLRTQFLLPVFSIAGAIVLTSVIFVISGVVPGNQFLAQTGGSPKWSVRFNLAGEVYWPTIIPPRTRHSFVVSVGYNPATGQMVFVIGPIGFEYGRNQSWTDVIHVGGVRVIVTGSWASDGSFRLSFSWGEGSSARSISFNFNEQDLVGMRGGDMYIKPQEGYARLTLDGPGRSIHFVHVPGEGQYRVDVTKNAKTGRPTKACITPPGGTKVCSDSDPAGFCRILAHLIDRAGKAKLKALQDIFCGGYKGPSGKVAPPGRTPSREH